MADEYSTKRIINLPAESGPAEGDVFVVDNESTGTKKLQVPDFLDSTLTHAKKAAPAEATGKRIGMLGEVLNFNGAAVSSSMPIDLFLKEDPDYQANFGYSGTSGNIVESANNNISGYIPVFPGETVQVYYNYQGKRENFLTTAQTTPHKIAFYTAGKTWEKTIADFSEYSSGVLTVASYGYIRFQFYGPSAFLEIFKSDVNMIDVDKVRNALSFGNLLTGETINWLNPDSDDYLYGYGFSGTSSSIVENAQYSISNYVRVYKQKTVSIPYSDGTSFFTSISSSNTRKIAYYGANKTWIKTISFNSSSVPFDSDSVDLEFDGYIRIQFLNIYTPSAIYIEDFKEIGGEFLGESGAKPKWYAIGDSITDGRYSYFNGSVPVTGTDHTAYYGYLAAKYLHIDIIEHGYGGMGFITAASDGTTLIDIINMDFINPSLITICLGINDIGTTPGDENSAVLDGTWSGAVRNVCEALGAKYPNAQIVFMSPINSNNRGSRETIWSRKANIQNNLDTQRALLKHWCDVYNYKFLDMTIDCPINVYNIVDLFPDKLHPSKKAHNMIAKWLASALPFRPV